MESIWAKTSSHSYPIHVGEGCLADPVLFKPFLKKQVLIVSTSSIAKFHLAQIVAVCESLFIPQIDIFLVPEGEAHKTLALAEEIWTYLLEKKHYRDTTLIALGGGMIGDLTGFVAACYLRGVNLIQCPTSLLAQIDAAIGGKVGVNHMLGKNMIGAFYPPCTVVTDILTLETLSQREYVTGIAELIKYGLALDPLFFTWLENNMAALLARDKAVIMSAVKKATSLKVAIVEQDEKDQKIRMLLNFGHTIGHALENLFAYQSIRHGEAVALGMIAAVNLSILQGNLSPEVLERVKKLLESAHLPVRFPAEVQVNEILARIEQDKKHQQKQLVFVLLKEIGQAYCCSAVTMEQIVSTLKMCGAKG